MAPPDTLPKCPVCASFDKIDREFAKSPELSDQSVLRQIEIRRLDHELTCKAVAARVSA